MQGSPQGFKLFLKISRGFWEFRVISKHFKKFTGFLGLQIILKDLMDFWSISKDFTAFPERLQVTNTFQGISQILLRISKDLLKFHGLWKDLKGFLNSKVFQNILMIVEVF